MANKSLDASNVISLLKEICTVLNVSVPNDPNNTTAKAKTPKRCMKRKIDDNNDIETAKKLIVDSKLETKRRSKELHQQTIRRRLDVKLNQMDKKAMALKQVFDDIKQFVAKNRPDVDIDIDRHEEQIGKEISEIKKLIARAQQDENVSKTKITDEIQRLSELVDKEEEESRKRFEEVKKRLMETATKVEALLRK